MIRIELKNNLFLIGDKVFSYETNVALIQDQRIVMLGKFSRTTTKQINWLSGLTGYPVVHDSRPGNYFKFYAGVGRLTMRGCLSQNATKKMEPYLKTGFDFSDALFAAIADLTRKDRELARPMLEKIGHTAEGMNIFLAAKELGLI